ncbi:MAG: hypothetical protein ACI9VT_000671 [Psychroserpens sp.]|jgi:hypothetical protein
MPVAFLKPISNKKIKAKRFKAALESNYAEKVISTIFKRLCSCLG